MTYDGSQWNLYLDGIPDGTSTVNKMPNYESIQFAAIGGALNSTGARDGAFNGTIDEVYIFAGALSPQEIINLMGNLPPVADAGDDQTVSDSDENSFELITLDGFASSDPDGTIVSYEWDIDGDQITDYTGETVLDVPLVVGIHTVTLTVEDNEGATDSDDVVITVNPGGAPTMHVDSIVVTKVDLGKGLKKGRAEVVIVDASGVPVSGATVTGTFTEDIIETVTATTPTDEFGVAVLETSSIKGRVHLTFCIDDVVLDPLTYDESANVETCDSNY